jgi:hypothetical protein
MLRYVNRDLPARTDLQKPALVLFTYGGSFVEEPVYNTGVAWTFDADILRAHDLGLRNPELFATLARAQPARTVYRFDGRRTLQGLDPLIRLGTVGELVAK